LPLLEGFDGGCQRGRVLVLEEQAGGGAACVTGRDDCVQSAAACERDHRAPCGLGLDGHEPEVLFLWVDERPAAGVQPRQLGIRHPAQEFGVGRGLRLRPAPARPVAHDHEPPAQGAERLEGDGLHLVRYEAAHEQVEVVGVAAVGSHPVRRDGRMHDCRFPTVVPAHPVLHGS